MTNDYSESGIIGAERRRIIYNLAVNQGSVNIVELAEMLHVTHHTIRRDLDALQKEGKLTRSHGGAILRNMDTIRPTYSETRDAFLEQKALIGDAALDLLPSSGSVFILGGSTTEQLALRINHDAKAHITTNSPSIASHLAANSSCRVTLLGGDLIPESLITDCSLAGDVIERTYWDVAFMGASGIDLKYGITGMDLVLARLQDRIAQHSLMNVFLCDSSKFGRASCVKVADISAIDVLITDKTANQEILAALEDDGIRVMISQEPFFIERKKPRYEDEM